jgi:hypothetical protein
MRDRQVSKRHAAAGVGAAEDSETRTSCYLTGERGERPRWCREELWAPCSGYTSYTARYWGLFFARVIHRESRGAIYLSFVRASFCALGAAPSHLSIYTAARGQLSINYPERGRMRNGPGRVGGVGDEEPQWRSCSWSKGGQTRRTRPGHFSRNLSPALSSCREGKYCPIGAWTELLFRWPRKGSFAQSVPRWR